MEGLLFVRIPMVLVAGENVVDIGRIEPARVDLLAGRVAVRVVCKQVALPADPGRVDQVVNAAAMAAIVEGLAGGVRRARIGAATIAAVESRGTGSAPFGSGRQVRHGGLRSETPGCGRYLSQMNIGRMCD
jgi:hypothetical protein